jgi:recombination protein RecT
MATQIAERRANPLTVIRQNLTSRWPRIQSGAAEARHGREIHPRCADGDPEQSRTWPGRPQEPVRRIVRLAQDGLLPDGREAAIVKFGNKAQAMPMIAGILKKIRQSGDVSPRCRRRSSTRRTNSSGRSASTRT